MVSPSFTGREKTPTHRMLTLLKEETLLLRTKCVHTKDLIWPYEGHVYQMIVTCIGGKGAAVLIKAHGAHTCLVGGRMGVCSPPKRL